MTQQIYLTAEIANECDTQSENDKALEARKRAMEMMLADATNTITYIPLEEGVRKIMNESFVNGTRVIGRTFIESTDIHGNSGIPVVVESGVFLLWTKLPRQDLIQIPLANFIFHCESSDYVDFEKYDSFALEPHALELTFQSVQLADNFAQVALTEGGVNFALTLRTGGHIEVIIIEASHG